MTKVLSTKPRFDVYRAITDKIVQAIEAGAGKFVMPWHFVGIGVGRPTNAVTGKRYHGVNAVGLWAEAMVSAFDTGHWATYRQWQELGAQVRRGERSAVIIFYRELEEGGSSEDGEHGRRFVARASHVFNAEQVDGWRPPEPTYISSIDTRSEVEALVQATGAAVRHGGDIACYMPREDCIRVPDKSRFHGSPTSSATEAYYSTLLHELTHWTGAPHRLNREFGRYGTCAYAAEELVAELGAAFLCADLQIANDPRPDHAAYMAQWLRLLKDQPHAIFVAAREANRAATFLHEHGAGSA